MQVTYIGYPGTTGLSSIDYRLTDAICDPPGRTEQYHCEELLRLARCFLCYTAPADAPPVNDLPALRDRRITFGSFNNFAKVTPAMLKLWANILRQVNGSRLLLKARCFATAEGCQRVRRIFESEGIAPGRIELRAHEPSPAAHLTAYGQMDVALDTFPYCGTTTTCEALWMGVPVVTLAGQTHASRVGLSLLSAGGLVDYAAGAAEEYVAKAVGIASNVAALAQIRKRLRQQIGGTPLLDGRRHAREVESAYREIWRRWCG